MNALWYRFTQSPWSAWGPFLLLFVFVLCTGCTTTAPAPQASGGFAGSFATPTVQPAGSTGAAFVQAFGPIALQVAEVQLAQKFLAKNPRYDTALLAVADAIDLLSAQASDTEISEAAIRAWVGKNYAKWGFLPEDQELLVAGLLSARDAALASIGLDRLRVGEPMLSPWLNAVRSGLRAGVARFRAKAAPLPPVASTLPAVVSDRRPCACTSVERLAEGALRQCRPSTGNVRIGQTLSA